MCTLVIRKYGMAKVQHNRITATSMLQIGFSRNNRCANKDGFRRYSHIYVRNNRGLSAIGHFGIILKFITGLMSRSKHVAYSRHIMS